MINEIISAANFITHLLRCYCHCKESKLYKFQNNLIKNLTIRYKHIWHPSLPSKGSGLRAIRINSCRIDRSIIDAAIKSNIEPNFIHPFLPNSVTIWIDPGEVYYRFGEDGFLCILFDKNSLQAWKAKIKPKKNLFIRIKHIFTPQNIHYQKLA